MPLAQPMESGNGGTGDLHYLNKAINYASNKPLVSNGDTPL